MKKITSIKNPYIIFAPFLFFYILFILKFQGEGLWGDEPRYILDVHNLMQGFYSPPQPNITLHSGPGYQLTILPLVALKVPFFYIRALNGVFMYLSVVLLFKVLINFVSFKKTLLCCFFWASYYNIFDSLTLIVPETISPFLVILLLYFLLKAFNGIASSKPTLYLYLSGLTLGWLILIKVIFGYVLLIMLAASVLLWICNKKVINYKKSTQVLLIAFIVVLPYLLYTYQLTGRMFYWAATSGNNLYWMSTPHEGEYGSWFPTPIKQGNTLVWGEIEPLVKGEDSSVLNKQTRGYFLPGYQDTVINRSRKDFEEIALYNEKKMEQDDVYKRIAIENIKANPLKFIQNCFSNVGRMLFNYPYSYTLQKPGTLIRLPLNGVILVFTFLCALPTLYNWKQIPFAIRFIFCACVLYFGGSIFGSAEIRMFTVIVPALLVWIAYVIDKSVKIKIANW